MLNASHCFCAFSRIRQQWHYFPSQNTSSWEAVLQNYSPLLQVQEPENRHWKPRYSWSASAKWGWDSVLWLKIHHISSEKSNKYQRLISCEFGQKELCLLTVARHIMDSPTCLCLSEHELSLLFHIPDYLCKPEDNIYNIDFTRFKIRDLETGTVLFEIAKPPNSGEWQIHFCHPARCSNHESFCRCSCHLTWCVFLFSQSFVKLVVVSLTAQ